MMKTWGHSPQYRFSSVQVFSCVVICVHLATELAGRIDAVPTDLVRLVIRHIELEEASMGLWEGILVHSTDQADLMLVAEIRKIDWKAAASPNELEVSSALLIVEGLKDTPEATNDFVGRTVVGEASD